MEPKVTSSNIINAFCFGSFFVFFFCFNLSLHCHCPLGNLGETLKKDKKKKTISNRLDEYVFISLLIM